MPENPENQFRNGEQLKAGADFELEGSSQDDSKSTVIVSKPAAANPSRDLNPGVMFGKNYQIIELIGKGGMSAVYKAHDRNLKRDVAVKVLTYKRKLDKKARARFVQEGIALSKLDHPNLIKVYEFGDADSAEPYLVMDFLKGVSLSDVMAPKKALPVFRAVSIIKQCVDALRHAHNKGIVHRDLKPSNVMLVEDPDTGAETVKIIDFGIAKVEELDGQKLTETGEVFGSPLYMSPEQCRGERLDERSDMYSLGCMFYELLTGKPPFVGVDFADTVGMHFNDSHKPLVQARPDVSCAAELDQMVSKLMAKSRKDRYQTMGDVSEDLEPIYDRLKMANREMKSRDEADRAKLADAKAVAAAAAQESKNSANARKAAEARKAANDTKSVQSGAKAAPKKKLADTLQEKATQGKMPRSKRKTFAAVALLLIVGFTAKEIYDVYTGIKKREKEEPALISVISQKSKELGWWQDDMRTAETYFDRGNYFSAYKNFRKALRNAEEIKDDNRNLIMSTTLEHLIDLCYVITNFNKGKISDTETFEDPSGQYKQELQQLQPVPTREEMLADLQKFVSSESPETKTSDHLSEEQKTAALKIAAISTDLALSAPTEEEALKLFEQANNHIKMLMVNKVPDFAELLIKQSQYLAGIGKSKEAANLLAATSNAMSEESDLLTRDRAMLKYALGCLYWQMNDKQNALQSIQESSNQAAVSGPETLKLITAATLDLMSQRQKESSKKINLLLPILRNQLPSQYWAIAQSLRLSAEDDLIDILAIVSFEKKLKDSGFSPSAAEDLQKLSNNGEAKLKRSIAILSRSRPYDKLEILKSYLDLCDIYLAAKKMDELEELYPTVIAYSDQIPDFDPLEKVESIRSLAVLKQHRADYANSEGLYQRAINIVISQPAAPESLKKKLLNGFNELMKESKQEEKMLDSFPTAPLGNQTQASPISSDSSSQAAEPAQKSDGPKPETESKDSSAPGQNQATGTNK